jgi:hypothetical protein
MPEAVAGSATHACTVGGALNHVEYCITVEARLKLGGK